MDLEDSHRYQTLFNDHLEGVRVSISPHTSMPMRIEKGKCYALSWGSSPRQGLTRCMITGVRRYCPSKDLEEDVSSRDE